MWSEGGARPIAILYVGLLIAGCATISSRTTVEDAPLGERRIARTIRNGRYDGTARLEGDQLVVDVQALRDCAVVSTPIIHRRRLTTKTIQPLEAGINLVALDLGLGVASAALGVGIYAEANELASQQDPSTSSAQPADYRHGGVALIGVGGALAVIGVIDAIRARDEVEDLGRVRGPSVREVRPCSPAPAANVSVGLSLGERRITRSTGAGGRISIPLRSLRGHDAPDPSTPLTLTLDDTSLNIPLDDEVVRALAEIAPPARPASSTESSPSDEVRRPIVDGVAQSTLDHINRLLDGCKGEGTPGDVAHAYAAYGVIDANDLGDAAERALDAQVQDRCAVNRAQAGAEPRDGGDHQHE